MTPLTGFPGLTTCRPSDNAGAGRGECLSLTILKIHELLFCNTPRSYQLFVALYSEVKKGCVAFFKEHALSPMEDK
jgi:hypothetical protein